jgi:hypothetical protein
VRSDDGVVLGEVVEDAAEVSLDTAAGPVREQESGAAPLHDDGQARSGKRAIRGHGADARL